MFYRFAVIPMFLFSGASIPMSQLPGWLRLVVQFVPLYHGVACAGRSHSGRGQCSYGVHLAVLLAFSAVGTVLCIRNFRRRLEV